MTRQRSISLEKLVSNIVLDCSLLRWFAYNRRRDEVLAAIAFQRTRAKIPRAKSWTSCSGTAAASNSRRGLI
jgi:hypothetical protein